MNDSHVNQVPHQVDHTSTISWIGIASAHRTYNERKPEGRLRTSLVAEGTVGVTHPITPNTVKDPAPRRERLRVECCHVVWCANQVELR